MNWFVFGRKCRECGKHYSRKRSRWCFGYARRQCIYCDDRREELAEAFRCVRSSVLTDHADIITELATR